jgi:hypothetical protein
VGVDLLFVDGEDYGTFGPPDVDVLLGSTYFAANLPTGYQPIFGVLFDMIGDADLQIPQESNSVERAPEVVSRVWDTAAKLGYQRYFPPRTGYAVTDDHIPLLDKGLRVIDVIDLDYLGPVGSGKPNYHHTPDEPSFAPGTGNDRFAGSPAWSDTGRESQCVTYRMLVVACGRKRAKMFLSGSVSPFAVT